MKLISVDRRRFLQTYRHVAFALQILSFIATLVTYKRVLQQHRLPLIFLVLPLLLGFLLSLNLFVIIRDRNLVCILRGAITGFISGFLSTVVVPQTDIVSSNTRSYAAAVLPTLEFLHLPVVSGAVMYTFCLMFSRLPPITIIILSVAISTCGAVIYSIGRIMVDSMAAVPSSVTDWSTAIVVFLIIFVCSMMPAMNRNCRTWVLCAVGFGANVYWQTYFFDTLQWNWDRSWFPIPGFLTGVVVLFLLDVVELTESGASHLPIKQFRKASRSSDMSEHGLDAAVSDEMTTAITWHAIAYIVERTSLTIIMEHRGTKSQGSVSRSDAWLCCLGMLGVVAVLTFLKEFSQLVRLLILMLGMLLYVCLTLPNGRLVNGFFLDSVFGIALLTTSCMSEYVVQ